MAVGIGKECVRSCVLSRVLQVFMRLTRLFPRGHYPSVYLFPPFKIPSHGIVAMISSE